MTDYSTGRYIVNDAAGRLIGRIDNDEYVRDSMGRSIYKIDGDEFYTMDTELVGFVHAGKVMANKTLKFIISPE